MTNVNGAINVSVINGYSAVVVCDGEGWGGDQCVRAERSGAAGAGRASYSDLQRTPRCSPVLPTPPPPHTTVLPAPTVCCVF